MATPLPPQFNPDLIQVFLVTCRCRWILCFAIHSWFVINNKGTLSRWEILHEREQKGWGQSWGHLYLNSRKPFDAFGTFSPDGKPLWNPKIFKCSEGGEGSLAQQMQIFMENSPNTYPYCQNYAFRSPNSNTYTQWILDQFPEVIIKLPWNAFGKGYECKK